MKKISLLGLLLIFLFGLGSQVNGAIHRNNETYITDQWYSIRDEQPHIYTYVNAFDYNLWYSKDEFNFINFWSVNNITSGSSHLFGSYLTDFGFLLGFYFYDSSFANNTVKVSPGYVLKFGVDSYLAASVDFNSSDQKVSKYDLDAKLAWERNRLKFQAEYGPIYETTWSQLDWTAKWSKNLTTRTTFSYFHGGNTTRELIGGFTYSKASYTFDGKISLSSLGGCSYKFNQMYALTPYLSMGADIANSSDGIKPNYNFKVKYTGKDLEFALNIPSYTSRKYITLSSKKYF